MTSQYPPGSPRRSELLSARYGCVLEHGLSQPCDLASTLSASSAGVSLSERSMRVPSG
jgi:hypothetical protein